MNFGKLAYNKVSDLVRDESFNKLNNIWANKIKLENNKYSFNLIANNKVFFNVVSSCLISFKVYVNNELQHYCFSSNNNSFSLTINKTANVLIEVLGDEVNYLNLSIFGCFEVVDSTKTYLILNNNLITIIKDCNNSFLVYSGENSLSVVNNFNNDIFQTVNYKYLSSAYVNNNLYCLVKKEDAFKVLVNFNTEILINENLPENSQIFSGNQQDFSFGIISYNLNKINIILFSESGEVYSRFNSVNLSFLNGISQIKPITNLYNTKQYFVVSSLNKNNFIVLCNLNLSPENSDFLKVAQIIDGTMQSSVLCSNGNFVFSVKNNNVVKVLNYNLFFDAGTKILNSSKTFKNVMWAKIINFNSFVLNFNNNLIIV